MTKMKRDSGEKIEPINDSKDNKKKKEFRKLKRPTKLGTLSREEIRKGIEAVIARRKASQSEGENLET